MRDKILIIGGNGYIGHEVQKKLNLYYDLKSCDILLYSKTKDKKKIIKNTKNLVVKNFKDLNIKFLSCFDYVIILAGLVGDPISKKYPKLSKKNDFDDMKKLIIKLSKLKIKKAIFVSTCSNYGIHDSEILLKENAELKPLSLYAKSKVKIEKFILSLKKSSNTPFTILRFATAYGLSEGRMRFDLTVNQFILEAMTKRELVIYDKNTIRPYCHVKDFSNIIYKIIKSKNRLTNFQVFNCGFNNSNYSKKNIIELIKKYLGINFSIKFVNYSKDKRNYKVDFSKLKKKIKINSIINKKQAFLEIKKFIQKNKNVKFNKMGNYKLYL
tara:strand:+ start:5790 stop:6767 length:978 start_codon:yes stop_codon:yes gene_type:complete